LKYFIILLISFSLHAQTLSLTKGWNLLGVDQNISDLSTLNQTKLIWKYDTNQSQWHVKVFDQNLSSLESFPQITVLNANDGFWALSLSDLNLSLSKQSTWFKPTKETTWQWQLLDTVNEGYAVTIYDIDLFDSSTELISRLQNNGKKVMCYFSAGSYEEWRSDKSDFQSSVLGNTLDGWENEKWLDIRSENVKTIMRSRIELAKTKGCDGVEPDNVDGYTNNSGFNLTASDQLIFNRFLAQVAHENGLFIALKNDLDQINELVNDFDLAVNEQCHEYNECDKLQPFLDQNKPVFNAEYHQNYLDDTNRTQLCQQARAQGLQTLILSLDLNDSFRYSCNRQDDILNGFGVGFGGSSAFRFNAEDGSSIYVNSTDVMINENIEYNSYYANIKDFNTSAFDELQTTLSSSKFLTIWVTKGWHEGWFNIAKVNEAVEAGKIPVFIYWYFGDTLVDHMPTQEEIDTYYTDVQRFTDLIKGVNGHKIVIMEPEFNKQPVLNDPTTFINFISIAIDTVKTNDKNTTISLCMTDTGNRSSTRTYESCGYTNCALGDKSAWDSTKPIYEALIDKLDFISFQQMLGQFSRDPSNPGTFSEPNPTTYTEEDLGIEYLHQRIANFGQYIYDTYQKPAFLPYIAFATATWEDANSDGTVQTNEVNTSGWEQHASNFYEALEHDTLRKHNLFGFSVMSLFDNPAHDKGGYQYFMQNEYHIGIIKSSAVDDVDNGTNGDIVGKGTILESVFNP
jgi:hypothetical protein